jgi:putative transposase
LTHHNPDPTTIDTVLKLLIDNGFDGFASAFEVLFNEAMQIERSHFLEAGPYERSDQRRGYANGFKAKAFKSRMGELQLKIPKTRGTEEPFYPSSLERGTRSERALKLSLAEMYVQGVSTRKVKAITEKLCGFEISSSQVSRATRELDKELSAWRSRPLSKCPYLLLDARYEKVRTGGQVVSCAVLIAKAIYPDGTRAVIGCSVSLSEAEVHWRNFLEDLLARGMNGIRMVTSDAHSGLKAALRAVLPSVPWQRCQFHLQQNAQAYVPQISMRKQVGRDIRAILNAPTLPEAERLLKLKALEYSKSAPRLAEWMEANVPESFTVYSLPEAHRRRMRTSNSVERLNKEIKRRTRVASLFPNEASLLRLVTAVISEISEEWETGRIYLNMNAE